MYRIERYSRRSNDRKKRGIYIFHNEKRKGDIHKKEYSDKKRGERRGEKDRELREYNYNGRN